jgi:hypothetical protein
MSHRRNISVEIFLVCIILRTLELHDFGGQEGRGIGGVTWVMEFLRRDGLWKPVENSSYYCTKAVAFPDLHPSARASAF